MESVNTVSFQMRQWRTRVCLNYAINYFDYELGLYPKHLQSPSAQCCQGLAAEVRQCVLYTKLSPCHGHKTRLILRHSLLHLRQLQIPCVSFSFIYYFFVCFLFVCMLSCGVVCHLRSIISLIAHALFVLINIISSRREISLSLFFSLILF